MALARSEEDCLRIGRRAGFDPVRYLELEPRAAQEQQAHERHSRERLEQQVRRELESFSLDWELIDVTSLAQVWETVSAGTARFRSIPVIPQAR